MPKIRLLLAHVSPLTLEVMRRTLALPEAAAVIEVVDVARTGRQAQEKILDLQPDVFCTGTHLPTIDTPELLRDVMSRAALPILVLKTFYAPHEIAYAEENERVAQLLKAGALDVFALPALPTERDPLFQQALVTRIKRVSTVPVISRRLPRLENEPSNLNRASAGPFSFPRPGATLPSTTTPPAPLTPATASSTIGLSGAMPSPTSPPPAFSLRTSRIVGIGASTGGPPVLREILGTLPGDYPFPILCVQHISRGFSDGMVSWLDSQCALRVKTASVGEMLEAATVYFAPEGCHLEVDIRGRCHLSGTQPVDGHCPSITTLFNSLARVSGRRSVAALLTGMGSDGASGLKAISDAGGLTYAQDEATCAVFGMPKVAIERGGAQHILPPGSIAKALLSLDGLD